ncbi:hypothetical protein SKAU_G00257290 [Synaphobranchus kaupii]|uniref:Uncharacterized protein n=1 Tax=Synaphobranchus kaupii TaxID=118154 RepID=A0A9Q1IQD5_SYNKA|nr:hypothetical protein SKAU_G00257290 [Synaphobranchus kaupii]
MLPKGSRGTKRGTFRRATSAVDSGGEPVSGVSRGARPGDFKERGRWSGHLSPRWQGPGSLLQLPVKKPQSEGQQQSPEKLRKVSSLFATDCRQLGPTRVSFERPPAQDMGEAPGRTVPH